MQHRALLFSLAAAVELLDSAQAAEAAAAAALEVPVPEVAAAGEAPSSGTAAADGQGEKEKGEADVEAGKPPAPPQPARPSALKRLVANPYVANVALLLALATPLAVVKLVLDANVRMLRALPAVLFNRAARRKGTAAACRCCRRWAPPSMRPPPAPAASLGQPTTTNTQQTMHSLHHSAVAWLPHCSAPPHRSHCPVVSVSRSAG